MSPSFSRGPLPPNGHRGGALLLVILTLVLVTLLAHGALFVALGEFRSVRIGARETLLRRAGAGVLEEALLRASTLPAPGEGREEDGFTPLGRPFRIRWEGLSPGFALLRVTPLEPDSIARPESAALVRVLDPWHAVLHAPAVLDARGGHSPSSPEDGDAECAPPPHPSPPVAWGGALPALGPFPVEELAARGEDPRATPPGASEAPEGEADAPVPRLWGVSAPLSLDDWVGAGVLAVDGDLVLSGGSTFEGALLASGSIRLEGEARVTGIVRAGGVVVTLPPARLLASPCRAALQLGALAPLVRPSRVPGGWLSPR